MGTIKIDNVSGYTIHVRVTAANGDTGNEGFFEILTGKSESWARNQWQVAFIYLEQDESTHVVVLKPGANHQVK